jgi:ATP-binding cassette subfamily G (WHITE) protein 2 (PDR)
MGFECAPRQTTADFLTSLTSPAERLIKRGFEGRTPRTADEFAAAWKASSEYKRLIEEIDAYDEKFPIGGKSVAEFAASRRAQQALQQYGLPIHHVNAYLIVLRRVQSPFTLSIYQQVVLCVERGFQRLKGDASVTISRIVANSVLALVVGQKSLHYSGVHTDDPSGSMFYNLNETTSSFYSRSVLIFLAILLNAFASALEVYFTHISCQQLTN